MDNFEFICSECRHIIMTQSKEETRGILDKGYICKPCLEKLKV